MSKHDRLIPTLDFFRLILNYCSPKCSSVARFHFHLFVHHFSFFLNYSIKKYKKFWFLLNFPSRENRMKNLYKKVQIFRLDLKYCYITGFFFFFSEFQNVIFISSIYERFAGFDFLLFLRFAAFSSHK